MKSVNQCTDLESDIYLSRVGDTELFEKVRNKLSGKTTRIFDSKTQGHVYHNYILANEDEYPVEMLSKAKELAEDQEDSFKIYDFDTLVQWQSGVTIVKELKEFLWKLRQSKDQLIDQLPDSMIDKLKETIEEIGYDRNAPKKLPGITFLNTSPIRKSIRP